MIKVVIDTNVLVSAVLNPNGIPAKIMETVYSGEFEPIVTDGILEEYHCVLNYKKFGFSQKIVIQMLNFFKQFLLPLPPANLSVKCIDPDDTKFLAAAVTGEAKFLITGNRKHFPQKITDLVIITPREMFDLMGK
jgi:putative PIN family toxin of toxin-antitoxin system